MACPAKEQETPAPGPRLVLQRHGQAECRLGRSELAQLEVDPSRGRMSLGPARVETLGSGEHLQGGVRLAGGLERAGELDEAQIIVRPTGETVGGCRRRFPGSTEVAQGPRFSEVQVGAPRPARQAAARGRERERPVALPSRDPSTPRRVVHASGVKMVLRDHRHQQGEDQNRRERGKRPPGPGERPRSRQGLVREHEKGRDDADQEQLGRPVRGEPHRRQGGCSPQAGGTECTLQSARRADAPQAAAKPEKQRNHQPAEESETDEAELNNLASQLPHLTQQLRRALIHEMAPIAYIAGKKLGETLLREVPEDYTAISGSSIGSR